MRRFAILFVLAILATGITSCQKEDNVSPKNELDGKKKETVEISGLLKSISMQDMQESLPFTIFCAGVSGENVDVGLIYNRTEQVSKYSAVWDGKYESKNDSILINLMLIRENTGALLKEMAYDSTYVNLSKIGIQVEKLRQPKTAVKVHNASNLSEIAYIKLQNRYGRWPIY